MVKTTIFQTANAWRFSRLCWEAVLEPAVELLFVRLLIINIQVEKAQYNELAANSVLFRLRPEAHLPTNWSPAFSYLI